MNHKYYVVFLLYFFLIPILLSCGGKTIGKREEGAIIKNNEYQNDGNKSHLPYSGEEALEKVYNEYGKRTIRLIKDSRISHPENMKDKNSCFIVMSKKDYYLYVYEAQGDDTVMLARYDCCFALKKGNKQEMGDMRTPHCTMDNPFTITEIKDASDWTHDFGDGRGSILAYGHYFHRLDTHGHKGIGIHGSTNNVESVPGRASEGCIRLLDEDLIDLRDHYTFVGMKVIIKAEEEDDLPFEVHAMTKQKIKRKRHIDPAKALSNEQVQKTDSVFTSEKEKAVTRTKDFEEINTPDYSEESEGLSVPVKDPYKNQSLEELNKNR